MRLNSARNELKRKIVISSQTGGLGQETLDNSAIDQLIALLATDDLNEEALGRLVIDLQSIMDNQTTDIILEDGDTLNIPSFRQTVSVIGEVFVPNAHMYKDNLTINEYISFSGGLTDYADDSNIYLIKSNGSIIPPSKIMSSGFFKSGPTMLESGDTIVIPLEIQPFNTVAAANELSQIIYQMAIAAAAVNSF
jgi:polysaccharide export outer membrane protein